MTRSRRKNCNAINAASFAGWIVLTAFLALAGLSYVYLTLQLYHLGERKKAIENELASLRTQNDVTNVQIAALTSRSALQRRLKEGYLKMVPISEDNIVRLTMPARPADADAIQPVANHPAARCSHIPGVVLRSSASMLSYSSAPFPFVAFTSRS